MKTCAAPSLSKSWVTVMSFGLSMDWYTASSTTPIERRVASNSSYPFLQVPGSATVWRTKRRIMRLLLYWGVRATVPRRRLAGGERPSRVGTRVPDMRTNPAQSMKRDAVPIFRQILPLAATVHRGVRTLAFVGLGAAGAIALVVLVRWTPSDGEAWAGLVALCVLLVVPAAVLVAWSLVLGEVVELPGKL